QALYEKVTKSKQSKIPSRTPVYTVLLCSIVLRTTTHEPHSHPESVFLARALSKSEPNGTLHEGNDATMAGTCALLSLASSARDQYPQNKSHSSAQAATHIAATENKYLTDKKCLAITAVLLSSKHILQRPSRSLTSKPKSSRQILNHS
ncbi:unnamed protein product, partial [Ectocarpus sp. 12 AP-2014]